MEAGECGRNVIICKEENMSGLTEEIQKVYDEIDEAVYALNYGRTDGYALGFRAGLKCLLDRINLKLQEKPKPEPVFDTLQPAYTPDTDLMKPKAYPDNWLYLPKSHIFIDSNDIRSIRQEIEGDLQSYSVHLAWKSGHDTRYYGADAIAVWNFAAKRRADD